MLAVPDITVHRTKIADWIELKAIASPDARIGFGTLVSGIALLENEQEENIADEDIAEEESMLDIFWVLLSKLFGCNYRFVLLLELFVFGIKSNTLVHA